MKTLIALLFLLPFGFSASAPVAPQGSSQFHGSASAASKSLVPVEAHVSELGKVLGKAPAPALAPAPSSAPASASTPAPAPAPASSPASNWRVPFEKAITGLDQAYSGNLGVYVKRLGDGSGFSFRGGRYWYLSSTTKVPVAIVLLREVEEDKLSLRQKLTLSETDYVDGAGRLQRTRPGATFTVTDLLERMIVESDSSAADMLIRLEGLDELNDFLGEGFGEFTTILQVRFDAYGELHPGAGGLTNQDFLALKRVPPAERYAAFAGRIGQKAQALRQPSIESAFERYYLHHFNSATLEAYGGLLENLVRGELLNQEHTELLLGLMEGIKTGDHRIKAGLPKGAVFAQKTGTQVGRICNMGVVNPQTKPVVVTACVEKFHNQAEAEKELRLVGEALSQSGVLD